MFKSWILAALSLFSGIGLAAADSSPNNFSDNWRFIRADEPMARAVTFDVGQWERVAPLSKAGPVPS
jgi:hypothetical protein